MTINEAAAVGFGKAAGEYELGRPSYPPAAVAYLVEVLGLGAGRTVVDLAAGTGKLTRLLVPSGAEVIAVEPVAAMRAELSRAVPGVAVLEGTAEQIPLADGRAGAVTVAQAFHWFDGKRALPEIHRVLGAGGRLGIVWNVRELGDPVQAEIHEVVQKHRATTPSHGTGRWQDAFEHQELFGELAQETFPMEHRIDADHLVARVFSTSFMATLAGIERRRAEDAVRLIAERRGGTVMMPYVTECWWCEAR